MQKTAFLSSPMAPNFHSCLPMVGQRPTLPGKLPTQGWLICLCRRSGAGLGSLSFFYAHNFYCKLIRNCYFPICICFPDYILTTNKATEFIMALTLNMCHVLATAANTSWTHLCVILYKTVVMGMHYFAECL